MEDPWSRDWREVASGGSVTNGVSSICAPDEEIRKIRSEGRRRRINSVAPAANESSILDGRRGVSHKAGFQHQVGVKKYSG